MGKDAKAYLSDILLSIKLIEHHVTGINNSAEFQENFLVSDAVLRRLAIIGEALAKAIKINPSIKVTYQKKIIALRHIVVHDYDKVDEQIIWPVIKIYLPLLKEEIEKLII
ncbi:MAG: HepT-like ribonuclease domain-containing protein [Ginsengibacter sp.]